MLSCRAVVRLASFYLFWVMLHYGAAHAYAHLCTPATLKGFVLSPFMVATPHCAAMRWLVVNGASSINSIWLVLGMAAIKCIAPVEIK